MPTTRSASRSATAVPVAATPDQPTQKPKRKAAGSNAGATKKQRTVANASSTGESAAAVTPAETKLVVPTGPATVLTESLPLLPAQLTFSFEDAKKHLISVDSRFEDLFSRLSCKPFEQLERVEPFRTLATSIIGQQISWLAARSVNHKFVRLFDPSVPETLPPPDKNVKPNPSFPTAQAVAATDLATLRTAGLSARKAEYIKDLASRFADGRLTAQKLFEADDEEMARMLIEVKGIGRWTVDMFAIFSLRRPDILPVGDLGVQRGLLRWFLTLHAPNPSSPSRVPKISPKKTPAPVAETNEDDASSVLPASTAAAAAGLAPATPVKKKVQQVADDATETLGRPQLPVPFTPSISRTLNASAGGVRHELPAGMTVGTLKSRLDGKKIKGAFLTPKEMEDLTESWRPYRSLAVYYMWSLAEMSGTDA